MDTQPTEKRSFVIITGISGAGKSLAMRCLEDQGYYCVDNLPPLLIPTFADLCAGSDILKFAIAIDIRGRDFFKDLQNVLQELPSRGFEPFIVFIEASPEVIIRRYSESRRQHPLAVNGRVAKGIAEERQALKDLRAQAHLIIDTSDLSPHKLRAYLMKCFTNSYAPDQAAVHIMSFGYKFGMPLDTDLVFDCRFLPNPYYVPELKPMSGLDEPVSKYVFSFPAAEEFSKKLIDLIDFLIPKYYDEGKRHLTIAFGCTGGRHRSTAFAEHIAGLLREKAYQVSVEHRDITKAEKSYPTA